MRSAVYYPHTSIDEKSADVLKRALLMWDQLWFIVPDKHYRPVYQHSMAEAIEIIGHFHEPDAEEKKRAHEDIEELVTRPQLPPEFSYTTSSADPYEIYPQKFLPETWDMLINRGMAGNILPNYDFPLSPVGGLCIMGILADACAGTTKARFTDRPGAYVSLAGLLGDSDADLPGNIDKTREQLVAVTLKLADTSNMTLNSLIQMRVRERNDHTGSLRKLRHDYVERIEGQLKSLCIPGLTGSDSIELIRHFESDMADDLHRLKTDLRLEFTQAAMSKEVIVSMLAARAS